MHIPLTLLKPGYLITPIEETKSSTGKLSKWLRDRLDVFAQLLLDWLHMSSKRQALGLRTLMSFIGKHGERSTGDFGVELFYEVVFHVLATEQVLEGQLLKVLTVEYMDVNPDVRYYFYKALAACGRHLEVVAEEEDSEDDQEVDYVENDMLADTDAGLLAFNYLHCLQAAPFVATQPSKDACLVQVKKPHQYLPLQVKDQAKWFEKAWFGFLKLPDLPHSKWFSVWMLGCISFHFFCVLLHSIFFILHNCICIYKALLNIATSYSLIYPHIYTHPLHNHSKTLTFPGLLLQVLEYDLDLHVIPHLSHPLHLCGFLTDSFDHGGASSMLALKSLYFLMLHHDLDYPDFFPKLYSLLTPSVFFMRHRKEFFRLTDLFLTSSHLPASLVASFAKRLARLALKAPPSGPLFVLPLVYNLILRHPALTTMIHKSSVVDKVVEQRHAEKEQTIADIKARSKRLAKKDVEEVAKKACLDVFDELENDPQKTKALDSSLWELVSFTFHYNPSVSSIARSMFQENMAVSKRGEFNTADFLAASYKSQFDQEVKVKALRGNRQDKQKKPVHLAMHKPNVKDFWGDAWVFE